jgi:hypothetical protein
MQRSIPALLQVAVMAGFTTGLAGQGNPPQFGCPAAEYRQFEFWVGDWDVTAEGKAAGTNLVTLEEDGCLIHEHWAGSRGGTGQSFNFYDRTDSRWHQVWVDNQGNVLVLAGRWADGRLRFAGTAPGPGGAPQPQRLSFTPNADGTVRQLWETTADGGKSWQVVFDGLYKRK